MQCTAEESNNDTWDLKSIDKDNTDTITNYITIKEIKEAIKTLKNNTSLGPDGILNCVFKKCGMNTIVFLQFFFNAILNTKCLPTAWKCSKILPTFKKGDKSDYTNYKPISNLDSLQTV